MYTIRARYDLIFIALFLFINSAFSQKGNNEEQKVITLTPGAVITDAIVTTQADGKPVIMTVCTGIGGVLNVFDAEQNKLIHHSPLSSKVSEITVWGYGVLSNRHVVVSTSKAELFLINPDDFTIKEASRRPGNSSFFWDVAVGADDMVYVGTYPTGEILKYNPLSDEWTNLGVVSDENMYVKSLVYDKCNGEEYLYAGTGTEDVAIWKINLKTKEKMRLPNPPGLQPHSRFFYNLSVHNNYIYILGTNDVFDVKNNKWHDKLKSNARYNSRVIKAFSDDNSVCYFRMQDNQFTELVLYNPDTKSTVLLKNNIKDKRLVESHLLGGSKILMTDFKEGKALSIYNTNTKELKQMPDPISGARFVLAVIIGSDEKIYASAYMPTNLMAKIDPNLPINTCTELVRHQFGQIEAFGVSGDWLLMGLYGQGSIASYNPKTNEYREEVFIRHNQQRPYVLIDIDGTLAAVGTVPHYGSLGGALTIYNVEKNSIDAVYTDDKLVPKQSVVSLAYKDGVIYGGTTIIGGLGINPSEKEAKVFAFDLITRSLIKVIVPIQGAKHVSALTFGANGNLYGITNGGIFEIDPKNMEIVKKREYDDKSGHQVEAMYYRNNKIYARMGRPGIFEIDPQTFERKLLVKHSKSFVIAKDGYMYFLRDSEVLRRAIVED